VWDCALGGILFSGASRNWTLENNIVESLHAGPPVSRFATQGFNLIGSGAGERDDEGRPLFIDPEKADYRLAARSPGVDMATSEGAPRLDASGAARRDDPDVPNRGRGPSSFYDVGAFERQPH